jgi:hypothetical protein
MTKDLFSEQSENYALYRPGYPSELFDYILSFVEQKNTAWDCATGNGQSAMPLSDHFQKVFASDISQKQLDQAPKKDNIEYVICPAEQTLFADNSFDLITVSQAYHWLDHNKFYIEANRVGKNKCVVAVWMYEMAISKEEKINQLIRRFYKDITGTYWDAQRKYVDDRYTTIPFDFDPLPAKDFFIEINFTPVQLLGYFSSWSATQNFIKARNYSPIEEIKDDLYQLWPQRESKPFQFPLTLKLGRIIK